MASAGAVRLYFKELASNDNSKNQFYMGPNRQAYPQGASPTLVARDKRGAVSGR
jgi:hypothetical protein